MHFHFTKHAKEKNSGGKLMKYNYDSESDVLSVTISKRPFDYAEELGDFIVHFDKKINLYMWKSSTLTSL